jgi:SAM-dependent methyltransferase/uncharacterized membrane protein YbhN (UPF0104 family)
MTPSTPSTESKTGSKWITLKWSWLYLIGLSIYLIVLSQLDWVQLGQTFKDIYLPFIVLLGALELSGWAIRIIKWQIALGAGSNAMAAFFISKGGGNLTPGRVGELSPILLKSFRTGKMGAWIVLDRILEASATLLIGLAGLVFVLGITSGGTTPFWIGGLLFIMAMGYALLFYAPWTKWLPETGILNRIKDLLIQAQQEAKLLTSKLPWLTGLTFCATLMDLTIGFILYKSFGFTVSFAVLALAQCVHAIVSTLPITPNATGIPYVAAAAILHQEAGIPIDVLTLAILVRFSIVTILFWPGVMMAVHSLRKNEAHADQGELFDALAADEVLYSYTQESLQKLNDLIPVKGTTLDVGCGDGVIGQAMDGTPMLGIDISKKCAERATKRGVSSVAGNVLQGLPYKDSSFDSIMCIDVVHHLEQEWETIFEELNRVLKPGGTLCIVEPDARNPFVYWTQAPHSLIRVAPWHNEPAIDPDELLPHLESLNYDVQAAPIHIEGAQQERSVFPLWQRLLKAPFVLALAWWYRKTPNKFSLICRKPGSA